MLYLRINCEGNMVKQTTPKRCYDRTVSGYGIIPSNEEHNCHLWESDHQDNSYISNVLMRKIFNIASTALTTVIAYKYIQSDVFAGHNKDIFLYFSLVSIPVVMAQSDIAVKTVDSIYCASGNDIVASFTKEINSVIDTVVNLPSNIYNLFSSTRANDNTPDKEVTTVPTIISQGKKVGVISDFDAISCKSANDNVTGEINECDENVA